jgi:hypothetical protein
VGRGVGVGATVGPGNGVGIIIGNCTLGAPTTVADFEREPRLCGRAGGVRRGALAAAGFDAGRLDVDGLLDVGPVAT